MTSTTQAISQSLLTGRPLTIVVRRQHAPLGERNLWVDTILADPSVGNVLNDAAILLEISEASDDFQNLAQVFPVSRAPAILVVAKQSLALYLDEACSPSQFLEKWHESLESVASKRSESNHATAGVDVPRLSPTIQAQTHLDSLTLSQNMSVLPSGRQDRAVGEPSFSQPAGTLIGNQDGLEFTRDAPSDSRNTNTANVSSTAIANSGVRDSGARVDPTIIGERALSAGAATRGHIPSPVSRQTVGSPSQRLRHFGNDDSISERDRIMKLVEADRREMAARRAVPQNVPTLQSKPTPAMSSTSVPPAAHSSLAIRLQDSHQVKHQFASTDRLVTVREWIKSQSLVGSDFLFCQVYPRRTFEAAEELLTLHDLGLSPTANLILKNLPESAAVAYKHTDASWASWLTRWIW